MEKAEFHQILQKYLKGNATDEEKVIVDAWYDRIGEDKVDDASPERAFESQLGRTYWLPIRAHIYASLWRSRKRRRYVFAGAAVALVLLFASYMQYSGFTKEDLILPSSNSWKGEQGPLYEVINNEGDEPLTVMLPDGSKITMEPRSSIKFTKHLAGRERKVYLHGKAFFSVAKDPQRPFKVCTKEVITKVLGTSFTVSAFPWEKDVKVSVATGKVSVYAKGRNGREKKPKEVILTANQLYVYNIDKQTASRSIVEEPKVIVPDEIVKRMRFEDTSPETVFEAIEKAYGVDIVFDETKFSACKITTSISDGNIFNRLRIICEVINAEYRLEEERIIIEGGGCHPYL